MESIQPEGATVQHKTEREPAGVVLPSGQAIYSSQSEEEESDEDEVNLLTEDESEEADLPSATGAPEAPKIESLQEEGATLVEVSLPSQAVPSTSQGVALTDPSQTDVLTSQQMTNTIQQITSLNQISAEPQVQVTAHVSAPLQILTPLQTIGATDTGVLPTSEVLPPSEALPPPVALPPSEPQSSSQTLIMAPPQPIQTLQTQDSLPTSQPLLIPESLPLSEPIEEQLPAFEIPIPAKKESQASVTEPVPSGTQTVASAAESAKTRIPSGSGFLMSDESRASSVEPRVSPEPLPPGSDTLPSGYMQSAKDQAQTSTSQVSSNKRTVQCIYAIVDKVTMVKSRMKVFMVLYVKINGFLPQNALFCHTIGQICLFADLPKLPLKS